MPKLKLADLRKTAGVSQWEAAKTVGVHPDTLADWEHGRQFPQPRHLTALAEFYGVSVAELFAEEAATA